MLYHDIVSSEHLEKWNYLLYDADAENQNEANYLSLVVRKPVFGVSDQV